ncbi:transcription elongation factor GreA [Candidatus Gracilibacteria bacterium]|nr:transcription elongation factor GreA [Candidatus Gracilibacteria bacterium]
MAKKDIKVPMKKILVTKEGLQKLEEELKYLIETRRKEVAERLAEAISYGDLSENSEYDEAKNEQAFVELRITELEEQIKSAEIITESKEKKGVVGIGSTVFLRLPNKEEHEYAIVGSTESDPTMHRISNESPVGMAILGKKAKETVEVVAPGGKYKYEILKVS